LSYDYKYEYKKLRQNGLPELNGNVMLKIFLRHKKNEAGYFKPCFENIDESYLNHASGYIIGDISLEQLKKISAKRGDHIFICLFDITPPGKIQTYINDYVLRYEN